MTKLFLFEVIYFNLQHRYLYFPTYFWHFETRDIFWNFFEELAYWLLLIASVMFVNHIRSTNVLKHSLIDQFVKFFLLIN